jgi:hypothetical protein
MCIRPDELKTAKSDTQLKRKNMKKFVFEDHALFRMSTRLVSRDDVIKTIMAGKTIIRDGRKCFVRELVDMKTKRVHSTLFVGYFETADAIHIQTTFYRGKLDNGK